MARRWCQRWMSIAGLVLLGGIALAAPVPSAAAAGRGR